MQFGLMRRFSVKLDFEIFDASSQNRARLREAWTSVLRQMESAAYYHHFEWYESYLETLEPDPLSSFFVVAYRNGHSVGVFPFRLLTRRIAGIPVRVLETPHSPVTLLSDFVFQTCSSNAGIVREVLEYLRHRPDLRWDVVQISNALEGSAALFSLTSDRPFRTVEDEEPGCHYVVCREFQLSPKLNNKRNRLARTGELEYLHIRDAQSITAAVDEFMNVEASGWKASEGTAIRCRPREVMFYHTVATRFAAAGAAQISLLRVGGKCIAGFYMLRTGRTLYWLKHGFDEDFAKSSPGQLLFTELVADCLKRGDVDRINFITNNEWHHIFSPRELSKRTALVFRANALGLASYYALRSKNLLRRAGVKRLLS
jgi:CelD/BcsL family acetyltransferase involved in cellulose biosynthesis